MTGIDTWADPQYVTLSAAGTATVRFRGTKPTVYRRVNMITIESPIPGPGIVSIFHNGQLRATRTLAQNMTAHGSITLAASEEITVTITDGPANSNLQVKITAHSEDMAVPLVEAPTFGFVDDTSGIVPGVVQRAFMVVETTGIVINAGNSNVPVNGADMRGFTSYRLNLSARVSVGAAYCPVGVRFTWTDFLGGTSGSSATSYREDWEWWASTASPGANQEAMPTGLIYVQDQCHGSFLSIELFNRGANQITIDQCYLWGSNLPLNRYLHQMSAYDDVLYENGAVALPAGNLYYTIPLPLYYGDVGVHVKDAAAANIDVSFVWGSNPIIQWVATAPRLDTTLVFPRRAAKLMLNRPAGAGNIQTYLISRRDKI